MINNYKEDGGRGMEVKMLKYPRGRRHLRHTGPPEEKEYEYTLFTQVPVDIFELRSLYSVVVLVNGLVFTVVVVAATTPWSVILTGIGLRV